jgi:outer membrane protein OmpA-like peptidoglycan-associated protein
MTRLGKTTVFAAASLIALTACTDPRYQEGGDRQRTAQGATAGAILGAIVGGTRESGNDRVRNAAVGAAIGAAIGGVVGSQLDAQAAELERDFDNGEIDVINTGNELIVRMPQDILFAFDSDSVASSLRSDLRVLANSLNRYPDTTVEVVGHTDSVGSDAYNLDLSERRASAVASVLINAGVRPNRLRVFGMGERQPIASNLSDAGRAQNRRVDITIRPNG